MDVRLMLLFGFMTTMYITMYLVFVPKNEYDSAPAAITTDIVKRRLHNYFNAGDQKEKWSIINKSSEEIMKLAVQIGLLCGALAVSLCYFLYDKITVVSIIIGMVTMVFGVFITRTILENEFKMWQARLLEGVDPFIDFIRAFSSVKALTTYECLVETIKNVPEPFRSEMKAALDKCSRDGKIEQAFDAFSSKARHPVIDDICNRLKISWDSRLSPDMFNDIAEDLENEKEEDATNKTLIKMLLTCSVAALAFLGAWPIYGYPVWSNFLKKLSEGFGM